MGYGKKIYDSACQELEHRRQAAESGAQQALQNFFASCPRAREIKEEMASNAARAAKAVVGGGDVRAEMLKLKDKGLGLKAEYANLLHQHGLTERDVTQQYACPLCRDTGYTDGRMCGCLKNLQRSMAYEKLSMSVPLEKSTFANFSLDYYRDDERAFRQMENILRVCQNYAEQFRTGSPSLFFKGGTGLGKTHLSLAIAGKAIEKGYGVIYGSSQSFAVALEKERFDKVDPDDAGDTNSQLLACDLFILDDLGTEFPSAYVNAALYNIVNTRMLADKPTIISTNLSLKELEGRYSERFASRIIGYYAKMEFIGKDIRGQMRRQKSAQN